MVDKPSAGEDTHGAQLRRAALTVLALLVLIVAETVVASTRHRDTDTLRPGYDPRSTLERLTRHCA